MFVHFSFGWNLKRKVKNNLTLIDVGKLHRKLGGTLCRALPGYNAFMGCDYKTAFCRKGKVWPFLILENTLICQEVLNRIGLPKKKINEDYSTWIEKYVFAIYGKKRLASVNEVRLEFFLKKNKPNEIKLISNTKYSDDSQLPPCSCVLKETTNQTKYITGFAARSIAS